LIPTDSSAGYSALVTRLRALYATASKTYYLTGAPQCIVPDANMAKMISAAKFDMLFLQFYNTQQCSAASWVSANPQYTPGGSFSSGGFTFDAWASWLAGTPSADAMLYITLPGAPAAANSGYYLTPAQAKNLASAYYCRRTFGGIGLWDATYANGNVNNGVAYYAAMKNNLLAASTDSRLNCASGGTTVCFNFPIII
jgi:chitinase